MTVKTAPGTQIGFRAYLWQFKSGVVAAVSANAAGHAGFGLGDGSIALRPFDDPEAGTTRRLIAHPDAALLCMAASPDGEGFVSGGDDGQLMLTNVAGEGHALAMVPRKWIEHVAVSDSGDAIAYAAGKRVGLLDARGNAIATFEDHPSTVTGIAFNPKGRRLVAAHYGGVSLWWAKAEPQPAKRLNWKGSHIAATWSPDGKFVMTATQENELHGWRLSDSADMRMSGYPTKPRSLSWSRDGRWLATSGAEVVVVWDCKGKGPMGSAPLELSRGAVVTAVACHPRHGLIASGHADGQLKLGRINDQTSIELERLGTAPVTALGWSADGRYLLAGAEDGTAGILDFGTGA
ncbi:MAG: WD40 repeat domain-containing protein [Ferrovibrio sp.]|uniref:WD40 repeat domain-containing protein n=1 Tax=Ferrovibrio sp. TaxID=1917215 RepID=UPI00262D309C|nr:WD40 repeat domain-containing protein [Ferrovibrio sp.]MCW0236009.1 WD40 repeat domain-containing protein [Ferrovibrio sp.]